MEKNKIEYACTVMISGKIEKVSELFLQHMIMSKTKEVNTSFEFEYPVNETTKLMMKETIESNNLPDDIILIYEISGVYNRCVNIFEVVGKNVKYTMECEFVFDHPNTVAKETFIESSQNQIEHFKNIVENNE